MEIVATQEEYNYAAVNSMKEEKVMKATSIASHACVRLQGRIQDFHWGGAQKIMCLHAHYEHGTELPFAGIQGSLKGPEGLGLC